MHGHMNIKCIPFSYSVASNKVHTNTTPKLYTFSFSFCYMFRSYILIIIMYKKIEVQKEKCYRRELSFAINLLKIN